MSIRQSFLRHANRVLIDAQGESEYVRLQPPASPQRIVEIERELGFHLPKDLTDLLAVTAGLELLESLDLASVGRSPVEDVFQWVLTMACDGAGNQWFIELQPDHGELGPVWLLCQEPRVLIYQSADLATFVDDYLRYASRPHDGPVADVLHGAVRRVAHQSAGIPCERLLGVQDTALCNFARSLPAGWFVRDLRGAKVGDGMPLERFGPGTPLRRAGTEHLYAYGSRTPLQRLKSMFTGRKRTR